jgi:uncharacterized protein DUF2586
MNDIIIDKTNGGLGRKLPGEDHISGILYYVANGTALPTGFGTDKVKQITSLKDAEDKGITAASADYKVLHYHISEFFRISPAARLYVMVGEEPAAGTIDYVEMHELINFAEGKIRQVGVYVSGESFATTQVTTIQSVVKTLEGEHKPFSVLFVADFSAVADLTTMGDLRALDAEKVTVLLGQDGTATGKTLFTSVGKTVGVLGAVMGLVSLANVSENIGWPKKFKPVTGTELDVPAFAEGSLLKDLDTTVIDGLNTKGYVFLVKHIGASGSYVNDSHTCCPAISDYAYLENNRTMDKAIRGIRTYLIPELNSPLRVNKDTGELSVDSVMYFESLASKPLEQMEADGDLSGFDIHIDPSQNVVSTSKLAIKVTLIVNGVARTIELSIGLGTSV